MKLRKFNRETCRIRPDGHPYFSVSKGGIIRINREGSKLLQLKSGDKINILQDEERPKDWYVEKTTDELGLIMRDTNKNSGLVCNASAIAAEMIRSLSLSLKTTTMRIAPKPAEGEIYAILTGSGKT